ncbi:hypothetical protein GUJ93_ZPchr0005g15969 [Zizania palustris]|uniref:Ig-like domain-containing protein n=1 Tax=Zizania palustris TaxID=103762 RepID=A0A8J5T9V8_ZIZPA|nr:hypothetical protein GUJ93_ZPchr0005g15969 [Zizania palustris]
MYVDRHIEAITSFQKKTGCQQLTAARYAKIVLADLQIKEPRHADGLAESCLVLSASLLPSVSVGASFSSPPEAGQRRSGLCLIPTRDPPPPSVQIRW